MTEATDANNVLERLERAKAWIHESSLTPDWLNRLDASVYAAAGDFIKAQQATIRMQQSTIRAQQTTILNQIDKRIAPTLTGASDNAKT